LRANQGRGRNGTMIGRLGGESERSRTGKSRFMAESRGYTECKSILESISISVWKRWYCTKDSDFNGHKLLGVGVKDAAWLCSQHWSEALHTATRAVTNEHN
jgi:hypothetical protein